MKDVAYSDDVNKLLDKINNDCFKCDLNKKKIDRFYLDEEIDRKDQVDDVEIIDNNSDIDNYNINTSIYIEEYKKIDDITELGILIELIKEKEIYQYKNTILRLMLESYKEINDLEEVLLFISDDIEYEEYKLLIDNEKNKIEVLRQSLEEYEDEDIIVEDNKNKLIFIPTSYGNIRVLEELDHIPRDYYAICKSLFDSISNGTFKGVKRFNNQRELLGFSEVRGDGVRVIFKRLNKDKYAIISVFLKKCNNDKLYKKSLISKVQEYKKIESTIHSLLNDESFIEENEKICDCVYNKIDSNVLVKEYVL